MDLGVGSAPLTSSTSSSNSAVSLWLSIRRKNSLGRARTCPLQLWSLAGTRAAGRGGRRSSVLRWSRDSARPARGLPSSASSSVLPFPSPDSRDSRSPHWLRRLRLGARPTLFQLERRLLQALLGPQWAQGELRRLDCGGEGGSERASPRGAPHSGITVDAHGWLQGRQLYEGDTSDSAFSTGCLWAQQVHGELEAASKGRGWPLVPAGGPDSTTPSSGGAQQAWDGPLARHPQSRPAKGWPPLRTQPAARGVSPAAQVLPIIPAPLLGLLSWALSPAKLPWRFNPLGFLARPLIPLPALLGPSETLVWAGFS